MINRDSKFQEKLLTVLILANGESERKILDIFIGTKQGKYQALNKLIEKKFIKKSFSNNVATLKLKQFEVKRKEYVKDLWNGADSFEIKNLYDGTKNGVNRKHRYAEVLALMVDSNISITPDKYITDKLGSRIDMENRGANFTPLSVYRKILDIGKDMNTGARAFGFITSVSGIFSIYNAGKSGKVAWYGTNEILTKNMRKQILEKLFDDNPFLLSVKESNTTEDKITEFLPNASVIVTGDYEATIEEIMKNKNAVSLQDNTFVIPCTSDGTQFLYLMTDYYEWHKILCELFIDKWASDQSRILHPIDGYIGDSEVVVALDLDAQKLKNISSDTKTPIKLICYDFQEEILKKVMPKNFEVIAYNPDEVMLKFSEASSSEE